MAGTKPATSLADLTPDPKNARKHTARNVGTIVSALHEVGAARSIVIDENNVVLAGNATIEAAAEAGIERVQVVDADGETIVAVRRVGLTPEQKQRLALYDNRAAELAEWDQSVIADLVDATPEIMDGLFTGTELATLAVGVGAEEAAAGYAQRCELVVECRDEAHMQRLYEALTAQGEKCRTLML